MRFPLIASDLLPAVKTGSEARRRSYLRLGLNFDPAWIVAFTASIKVMGVLQSTHGEPNYGLQNNYNNNKCNEKIAVGKRSRCGIKPFAIFNEIHGVLPPKDNERRGV
jgi:hypothetical protein